MVVFVHAPDIRMSQIIKAMLRYSLGIVKDRK